MSSHNYFEKCAEYYVKKIKVIKQRGIMTGYCSNSPLRCSNDMSMTLLTEFDDNSSLCAMSLVPDNSANSSSYLEQRVLQLGLIITMILLLTLIYIYYANLV